MEDDVSPTLDALVALLVGGDEATLTTRLTLHRRLHATYAATGLGILPGSFVSLDASRPWIAFWCLHSLALLGIDLDQGPHPSLPGLPDPSALVRFFDSCQHPGGGYGGGPGQDAHTATTYAAVAGLVTLGTDEALAAVHRPSLRSFLRRMIHAAKATGGIAVTDGGEADVRGCYTAVAAAWLAGLDVQELDAEGHVTDFVKRCQTLEGGIAGEPGGEAHGGYTYCGLACLVLLGTANRLDLDLLEHWAAWQQGTLEGGFRGRTNKLVDGCYSFWVGALSPLLAEARQQNKEEKEDQEAPEASIRADSNRASASASTATAGSRISHGSWTEVADVLGDAHLADIDLTQQAETLLLVAGEAAGHRRPHHSRWGQSDGASTSDSGTSLPYHHHRDGDHDHDSGRDAVGRAQLDVMRADVVGARLFSELEGGLHVLPTQVNADVDVVVPTESALPLQGWILTQCQMDEGGLRDKPGCHRDYYHTCYVLSGLSISQHASGVVLGPRENQLRATHPAVNVVPQKVTKAVEARASKSA